MRERLSVPKENPTLEVTLEALKRALVLASPPLVGVLGYDLYGLLFGVLVTITLYARPRLASPLTVRPPLPIYEPVEPVVPVGAEPCLAAITAYNRWLRECKGNCLSACSYYQPSSHIPCVLLGVMRSQFPAGDPFTQSIDLLVGEVRVLIGDVRANNVFRSREELRESPLFKYVNLLITGVAWSTILFLVQQILLQLASRI